MSKKELRPCPFCGSPVRIRLNPLTGGITFICEDPGCGADVMFYAGDRRSLKRNVKLWDTREGR